MIAKVVSCLSLNYIFIVFKPGNNIEKNGVKRKDYGKQRAHSVNILRSVLGFGF
jgi:hypothetical protein